MPTKDQIKEWLTAIGEDREWLGQKLSVTKRAVDNWLSSKKEIPKLKLETIALLMKQESTSDIHKPLLLHPTKAQYDVWMNSWADNRHEFPTFDEWAIHGLDQMAAEHEEIHSQSYPIAADRGDGQNLPSRGPVVYTAPKTNSRPEATAHEAEA